MKAPQRKGPCRSQASSVDPVSFPAMPTTGIKPEFKTKPKMQSLIVKRSVVLGGHKTSVSLGPLQQRRRVRGLFARGAGGLGHALCYDAYSRHCRDCNDGHGRGARRSLPSEARAAVAATRPNDGNPTG